MCVVKVHDLSKTSIGDIANWNTSIFVFMNVNYVFASALID